jgi:hypothetical protein
MLNEQQSFRLFYLLFYFVVERVLLFSSCIGFLTRFVALSLVMTKSKNEKKLRNGQNINKISTKGIGLDIF